MKSISSRRARHAGAAIEKHIITGNCVGIDCAARIALERSSKSPILAEIRRCSRSPRRGLPLPLLEPSRRAGAQRARDWRHGLSLFGDLKYPAGFKQFDYVNADAPKGGAVRQIAIGTFDNFNIVVAGVKGALAAGIDCIYDTLLTSALDEVSDRIRPARRGRELSGRFFLGLLPAAR